MDAPICHLKLNTGSIYIERIHLPQQSVCMVREALWRAQIVSNRPLKKQTRGIMFEQFCFFFGQLCLGCFGLEFNKGIVVIEKNIYLFISFQE